MKEKNLLRLEQLEESTTPLRPLLDLHPPRGGWVRATREALGMSGAQLARRSGKTAQSIADIQKSEAARTVQLNTLDKLAQAMGCRLVYALVPEKPLAEIRRGQAQARARRQVSRVGHSMRLEEQGLTATEEARELERAVERLLGEDSRRLWD